MGLENANYISEIVPTNPAGSDPVLEGDDHIRQNLKQVLQNQFPNIKATGIVNATGAEPLPDAIERLWSPDAVLAFLIANWDAYSQTPTVNNLTFRAQNDGSTGNQLPLAIGTNVIAFNQAPLDAGGLYDTTQYRWIPQELGDYWVYAHISLDPNAPFGFVNCGMQIRLNGNVVAEDYDRSEADEQFALHTGTVIQITDAADYIDVWSDIPVILNGMNTSGARSFFTGHKINAAQPTS